MAENQIFQWPEFLQIQFHAASMVDWLGFEEEAYSAPFHDQLGYLFFEQSAHYAVRQESRIPGPHR